MTSDKDKDKEKVLTMHKGGKKKQPPTLEDLIDPEIKADLINAKDALDQAMEMYNTEIFIDVDPVVVNVGGQEMMFKPNAKWGVRKKTR